jgi:NitT/TauT family transport system substrate-binding protein
MAVGSASGLQAQELTTVNFMSPNDNSCGPYAQIVSQELGFFADEGLDVNLLSSETTIPFVAFLQNGDADIVTLDSGQVLQAASSGLPIKIVYEAYQFAPEGILVLEDSPIKTIADLKGKTVGLASDRDQLITAIALESVGLSIDDITTVVAGDPGPVLANAFRTNSIDAWAGGVADIAGLEGAGLKTRNITPAEVSSNPGNSFAVWGPTLEEKRPMIEAFVRAWAKGQHAGVLDTKAVSSICKYLVPEQWEVPGNGERLMNAAIYLQQLRRTVRYGELQHDVWEGIQGPYVSIGEIPEKIDVATFLDDSFTDAANDFTTTDVKTNVKEWKAANPDKLIQ